MSDSHQAGTAVERLLRDFVASHGKDLPAKVDSVGAEIEIDGRLLRILGSEDPDAVVIEADVCALPSDPAVMAELLLELHRINHEARFVHGWCAVIDDTDSLLVSNALPVSAVSAQGVENWLGEALDRAEALASVAEALLGGAGGQKLKLESVDSPQTFVGSTHVRA